MALGRGDRTLSPTPSRPALAGRDGVGGTRGAALDPGLKGRAYTRLRRGMPVNGHGVRVVQVLGVFGIFRGH